VGTKHTDIFVVLFSIYNELLITTIYDTTSLFFSFQGVFDKMYTSAEKEAMEYLTKKVV
jgi:hypothetical protein